MTTFDSISPLDGAVVGTFAVDDEAAVRAAVEQARAAQSWWAGLRPEERLERLLAWAGAVWSRREELADVLHAENGKPRTDCAVETLMALEHLRWAARNAGRVLRPRRVGTGLLMANHRAVVEQRPLGVVGVISPWNYPFYTPMGSVGYALAAGNGVVLKPSEHTPAVGAWMVESFAAAVPDAPQGLLGLVTGDSTTGAALCTAGVDKIAFTGSTATGRLVMATCAQTLTPVSLECGGKDATVVLADADLRAAARAVAWGAMSNAGQTCVGVERVYVVAAVRDAFLARLTAELDGVTAGAGPAAHYGPMTTDEQADVVRAHVADAVARGGRLVVGPKSLPQGRFLPPTVILDAPEDSLAVAEETFGPTLTVRTVADADDAVARVNAHRYGLTASVFGRRDARAVADRLDVGVVTVNAALAFAAMPAVPLGGRRDSGFGRIHGAEGLLGFSRSFTVTRKLFGTPGIDVMTLHRSRLTMPVTRRLADRLNRVRTTPPQPTIRTVAPMSQPTTHPAPAPTPRSAPGPADTPPATFCEAFQRTAAAAPEAVALRTPGDGVQITWAQYADRVRALAAGLHGLGVRHGDCVALMMRNRPEFHLLDTAVLHLGAVPFSVYNTSAPEQIDHVLRDARVRLVVAEECFVPVAGPAVAAVGARLVRVEDLDEVEATAPGDGFDFEASWRAVGPDDLVTLIYTSGTTGLPKGVEITHRGELAQCAATNELFGVTPADRFISFLPSAHIADRWSSHYTQLTTGTVLTCVDDPKSLGASIVDVRPTVFGAVPQVWQRLWNGISAAVSGLVAAEQDPTTQAMLATALELGRRRAELVDGGRTDEETERIWQLLDQRLFSVLRARIGLDACRVAISGAAPIPAELLLSLRGIGIPLSNVLGLSELSGMTTWSPPGEAPAASVGRPIPGVEVTTAADGELLFRGPVVMRGYRNLPDATAEALRADGWLRTGDLGKVDADGVVSVVDRKKEIMVSTSGKNISPVAVEGALLAACPLLGYAVAVGDARRYVTALLVLDPEALAAFAAARGLAGDHAALAVDQTVLAEVAAGVQRANERLSRPESVRQHVVLADAWEPGSPVLTPTRKLRRAPILARYADVVETLYVSSPHPLEPVGTAYAADTAPPVPSHSAPSGPIS